MTLLHHLDWPSSGISAPYTGLFSTFSWALELVLHAGGARMRVLLLQSTLSSALLQMAATHSCWVEVGNNRSVMSTTTTTTSELDYRTYLSSVVRFSSFHV